ncbi:hypothetical protein AC477_04835, partial [miscellaneous Crenarchaeota group-1 archaeon SG8-32-1]
MFSAKYAVKTVSRRKKRNILTILGLAIGVAMVASAQIATDTMIVSFSDLVFSEIGEVDVWIGLKNDSMFDQSTYNLIANNDSVQNEISPNGITPRIIIYGLANDPDTGQIETNVAIVGINDTLDQHFGKLTDIETGEERFVKDLGLDEIIIGRSLANTLNTEEGQTIVVGFTDNSDDIVNFQLTIKYIVKNSEKATWNGGDSLFLSLQRLRTLYGAGLNDIN